MADEGLRVEVVYALPERQTRIGLTVPAETTLREAVQQSGILQQHSEIDLERNKVGVFGRQRELDDPVAEGDRIEIYRPLRADPKDLRRQRARQAPSR